MKDHFEYDGLNYEKGVSKHITDQVTIELPLQITVNGEPYTVVMQSPGQEKELVTGLLFAEDVIADFSIVKWRYKHNKDDFIEEVELQTDKSNLNEGYKSTRSLLSVSSCGICGKRELEDIKPKKGNKINANFELNAENIGILFEKMRKNQNLFSKTGGCHGIAAFDKELNLLAVHEDIGRHNALDKVIGSLIQTDQLKQTKIITISGRISYEMVSKAFRAKIQVVAAVSAPSSLAIDFAKEFGLTLLGFCRDNRWTCYARPERIKM